MYLASLESLNLEQRSVDPEDFGITAPIESDALGYTEFLPIQDLYILMWNFDAILTIAVVVGILICLIRNIAPADWLFLGGVILLCAAGVIDSKQALAGFSNPGMMTVAALFVVAAGLRDTGILDYVGQKVLGSATKLTQAYWRLTGVTVTLSAFLNNTPIVAMFVPVVIDWCRRNQVSPSKLLIPLSYLTILGGTCTLIGTSTNLVVDGLMTSNGMPGIGLFEIGMVGLPYALVGVIYLWLLGPKLLPNRQELLEQLGESRREYLTEMRVEANCPLIGKSVEASSLRGLNGLFLIEIDRQGELISPVKPEQVIKLGDQLIFAGVVSTMVELEKIPNLVPVADPHYDVSPKNQAGRRLWEAVVSPTSPLVGKTLRDADFRATYGAAVLAMHRGGQRIAQKLGTVEIRSGDTMLLLAPRHFRRAFRNDSAFYLISDVSEWRPLRRDRAGIALAVFAALIVVMTTGWLPTEIAAILAAVAMVGVRAISSSDARQSIEWPVLITIAASFGIGTALSESGVAGSIANQLVWLTQGWGPTASLAMIFLVGAFLTAIITNNAAAVLMFPICLATAEILQVDSRPFMMALVLSASASFATPIGYQTNMMVYGPGGYKFVDFIRIGTPLTLILWLIAVVLIPVFWPF